MTRTVAKLGGSAASTDLLGIWTAALAGAAMPLVVVPGGGPFADEVRRKQAAIGFSERAAHAMAILAMEQLAHLILDRSERFRPARSLVDIERALAGGRVPVWMPSHLALDAPGIEESWDVTSDSLAAWLSGRVGARRLLLIKQTDDFCEADDVATLSGRGVVDAALPRMLPVGVALHVAGPGHAPSAARALAAGELPGLAVGRPDAALRKAG